jgi:hypothetical protein
MTTEHDNRSGGAQERGKRHRSRTPKPRRSVSHSNDAGGLSADAVEAADAAVPFVSIEGTPLLRRSFGLDHDSFLPTSDDLRMDVSPSIGKDSTDSTHSKCIANDTQVPSRPTQIPAEPTIPGMIIWFSVNISGVGPRSELTPDRRYADCTMGLFFIFLYQAIDRRITSPRTLPYSHLV